MRIHFSPRTVIARDEIKQRGNESEIFHRVNSRIADGILFCVWRDVLPRNYDEEIKIDPPGKQKLEIHAAKPQAAIGVSRVRTQRQRAQKRNGVQKENYVAE